MRDLRRSRMDATRLVLSAQRRAARRRDAGTLRCIYSLVAPCQGEGWLGVVKYFTYFRQACQSHVQSQLPTSPTLPSMGQAGATMTAQSRAVRVTPDA
jgi:hypothetical protein